MEHFHPVESEPAFGDLFDTAKLPTKTRPQLRRTPPMVTRPDVGRIRVALLGLGALRHRLSRAVRATRPPFRLQPAPRAFLPGSARLLLPTAAAMRSGADDSTTTSHATSPH